ncbi:MAG: hypothetical protein PVF45_04315 [Anaerolineae bacterium]|jgi:hypothetical protein
MKASKTPTATPFGRASGKQFVENLVQPCLEAASLEHHQGGTEANVFILRDVFKVGTPAYIDLEFGIYQDLQTRLGELYGEIFPQVILCHRDQEKAGAVYPTLPFPSPPIEMET